MSETWAISFEPTPDAYEKLLEQLYLSVTSSGWQLDADPDIREALIPADNPLRGAQASPLELVLARGGAGIPLVKDDRWLVFGNTDEPGWIDLGSDANFFRKPSAHDELVSLFRRVTLPRDTTVIGETEHRWARFQELGLKPYLTPERTSQFGFFWIETLSKRQLDVVLQARPPVNDGVLADIGDSRIVRLWLDPYEKLGDRREWRSLARNVGRT